MDIALSYLRQLHSHGYFQRPHSTCDGVWFKNHPACRDAATWERVKQYLVEENFLNEVWLSPAALKEAHLHPKDELDAWWFELTPKGAQAVEQASPDAP